MRDCLRGRADEKIDPEHAFGWERPGHRTSVKNVKPMKPFVGQAFLLATKIMIPASDALALLTSPAAQLLYLEGRALSRPKNHARNVWDDTAIVPPLSHLDRVTPLPACHQNHDPGKRRACPPR
jgi:hypothetical protein